MKLVLYLLFLTTTLQTDLTLPELRALKSQLEHALSPTKPSPRKLFTENEFQTGSAYVQQLQDTNSNLNEMMGHSKRQQEMKQVGQWFADVEEKLDDFRDGVSRKLNELHMSLQRPKVPMIGPAPGVVMHPYGHNQYDNSRRTGLREHFESPEHTKEESMKGEDFEATAKKGKKGEADEELGDMMDRRMSQVQGKFGLGAI